MEGEIECEQCKESVKRTHNKQRFCSPHCTAEYKKNERIRKWVEKKPRVQDIEAAGKMERSANYNKTGGWARKFSSVRG